MLSCQIKIKEIIILEEMKGVLFSCCNKIKEKIVMEEMKVRYTGTERWSNVHGGGIQEIVVLGAGLQLILFLATAAGLNILWMVPDMVVPWTLQKNPFWLQSNNLPFNPPQKNTYTHTLLLTKACTRY